MQQLVEVAGAAIAQCGAGAAVTADAAASTDIATLATATVVPPTVFSAITGGLFNGGLVSTDPEVCGTADSHLSERKSFLEDVIAGDPSTAGGRLSSWLTRVVDQVCLGLLSTWPMRQHAVLAG